MRRSLCLPVFFCLIFVSSSEARSQFLFNRIALTDEPTPVFVAGNPQSMTFESLSGPIIDMDSNVILGGSVDSPSGPEEGVWFHRRSSSRLELHAKENSPAPGFGVNAIFGNVSGLPAFGPLKLESGTEYTYRARLKGAATTSANDTAVYRRGILVIREGDQFDLGSQDNTIIGDQFGFKGLAQETVRRPFPLTNTELSTDTAFQMPAFPRNSPREGQEVSGGVSGPGRLGDLRAARPLTIPRSLDVVFRGTVTDAGGQTIPNNERIFVRRFSGGTGRPEVIAHEGGLPVNAQDVQFDSFNHPATAREHVFYGVRLSGMDVNTSNDTAIAQQRLFSNHPFLLLREGDPLMGARPGVVLGDLGTDNLLGGGGFNLIFNNQLVGPNISEDNDWALISASLDVRGVLNTRSMAQEGDFVERLPAGSALAGLNSPHFQLNLVGDAIFNAQFAGPNGDGDGLFYAHVDQPEPSLIVRTGQEFDIGGGVFSTISEIGLIEMSNPWDGRAAQINDRGEIVFGLTFTDGSQGIFTAVIPEPGTIVLACVGGIFVLVAARRRRTRRGGSSVH